MKVKNINNKVSFIEVFDSSHNGNHTLSTKKHPVTVVIPLIKYYKVVLFKHIFFNISIFQTGLSFLFSLKYFSGF